MDVTKKTTVILNSFAIKYSRMQLITAISYMQANVAIITYSVTLM